MLEYIISCLILSLILLGFIPAMVAAYKNYRFLGWYIYGIILFPIALVHSLMLKKPVHCINILSTDLSGKRRRKSYRSVPQGKKEKKLSFTYICAVFFAKLIFGAFSGLAAFALMRVFNADTLLLRGTCIAFSLMLTLLLSAVEICGFSRLPIFADEITKRALIIAAFSVVASLPLFMIEKFIFNNIAPGYSEFWRFVCTILSLGIFIALLLKNQGYYYAVFYKFFDYCVLSLWAYTIYAAITLIWSSVSGIRNLIHVVAMPMQLFSVEYLSDMEYIESISYIYSSALTHLIVGLIILFSGLLCYSYKKKELAYRVEYRTKAFRMSRKRVLRRHIPRTGMVSVRPLN